MQNSRLEEQKHNAQDLNNSSMLTSFDLGTIEEMDPSLNGGYRVLYDKEVPIELRLVENEKDAEEPGTLESIKTKILILGEVQNPQTVKIELSSEADLFFHHTAIVTLESYEELRERQQLNVAFDAYIGLLIKMFNNVNKEPHVYMSILFLYKDGKGRLDFIQNLEYKYIDLLTIDFETSPEEVIRETISFRYNSVKAKLIFLQNRMKEFSSLVKVKNPSLLIQLQKSVVESSTKHNQSTVSSKQPLSKGQNGSFYNGKK